MIEATTGTPLNSGDDTEASSAQRNSVTYSITVTAKFNLKR